jgi:two-component system, cell cycle response regulator CpdR
VSPANSGPYRRGRDAAAVSAATPGTGQPIASILVVDDEPIVAEFAARALEGAGFKAIPLDSPLAAQRRLERNPAEFDVLITDLLMPQMSGLDLAASALRLCPQLKVVLATGLADAATDLDARRSGIHAVLQKPFTLQDLVDTLARLRAAS